MHQFMEYIPFILLLGFFIFLVFAVVKSQRAQKTIMSKYNKSFEYQEIMMDRQAQAIKLMEESNKLLAEILKASKK